MESLIATMTVRIVPVGSACQRKEKHSMCAVYFYNVTIDLNTTNFSFTAYGVGRKIALKVYLKNYWNFTGV